MLRGVNRRIVEITDTGSDYFEKVLFFVKNDYFADDAELKREADRIVYSYFDNTEAKGHTGFLRYSENAKHRKRRTAVLCTVGALILVTALMIFIKI